VGSLPSGTDALTGVPLPPAVAPLLSLPRPLCVIDRSLSIDRAEADLSRALFITVDVGRPVIIAQQIVDEVARNFGIDVHSMAIIITSHVMFFLITFIKVVIGNQIDLVIRFYVANVKKFKSNSRSKLRNSQILELQILFMS
jgi:hypothetical protein